MRQWLIVFSISVGIIYENFVSFTKLCFVAFLPYTINYTTLVYATIFQVLSFSKLTSVKKVWRKKCTKLHTLLSKICMHIEVCICICIYVAAINLNISPFWLWRKFHGWAPAKLLDVFWHFQSSFLSTIAIEKLYASQITNKHTHTHMHRCTLSDCCFVYHTSLFSNTCMFVFKMLVFEIFGKTLCC